MRTSPIRSTKLVDYRGTRDLRTVSGVNGPTLYTVLRRPDGTLERRDLPGGDTGCTVKDGQVGGAGGRR